MNVVPRPLSCTPTPGAFELTRDTRVGGDPTFARQLRAALAPATGFDLAEGVEGPNTIVGRLDPRFPSDVAGAYRLDVHPDRVDVVARGAAGLFYGLQTFRQLLPAEAFQPHSAPGVAWRVPCLRIDDAPRFQWRGVMLDCSRHFFDAGTVKSFIDALSLHKFNVFHWHLTDDQGWRIEIRKYPRLTEVGAWRPETVIGHANDRPARFDGTRYGGFYTQAQIRDVVAYAAERHVTVVPEIELPGHSRAPIAAYPELGNLPEPAGVGTTWGVEPHILNVEESTIRFYEDVLAEVVELFPSPFIHVGGDEAVKTQWRQSPRAQARLRELGLHDEDALQAYWIGRMDAFLTARGRRLIGWDEILEGKLAPGATVMSWRGDGGAVTAAAMGHDVVAASKAYAYLDYYQSADRSTEPLAIHGCITLEQAYGWPVVPPGLPADHARHVLGGQAQVWTEYMPDLRQVQYMVYPRALAIAEALWTDPAMKSYPDFAVRLAHQVRLLQARGVHGRWAGLFAGFGD